MFFFGKNHFTLWDWPHWEHQVIHKCSDWALLAATQVQRSMTMASPLIEQLVHHCCKQNQQMVHPIMIPTSPISLWCRSSLVFSNKVIDLLPSELLVVEGNVGSTAFLPGRDLFLSRGHCELCRDARLPPPLWALALLIFWLPGALTGALREFCWIWLLSSSPSISSLVLKDLVISLAKDTHSFPDAASGHITFPPVFPLDVLNLLPCYQPDLSLLMLQVVWCIVVMWGIANAFVVCLEILATVFGHLTCLFTFSQLFFWSIFRPLSSLKPFPHLPTLVVPLCSESLSFYRWSADVAVVCPIVSHPPLL